MVVYSLEVVHDMPCIPSTKFMNYVESVLHIEWLSVLLIVLTHVAIQVVYSHYMLTLPWNVCGMLNFDIFVLSKKICW